MVVKTASLDSNHAERDKHLRGKDFLDVGKKLESILPDHKMLNEVYESNPTSENLARHFYDEMQQFYPVSRVTVWETEDSCAEYSPD